MVEFILYMIVNGIATDINGHAMSSIKVLEHLFRIMASIIMRKKEEEKRGVEEVKKEGKGSRNKTIFY